MKNFDSVLADREKFIEWLATLHPELAIFGRNIDMSLVRGRKMTINNHFGINDSARQSLIDVLKEYYQHGNVQ